MKMSILLVILQMCFLVIDGDLTECLLEKEPVQNKFFGAIKQHEKFLCDSVQEVCCDKGCCPKPNPNEFLWVFYMILAIVVAAVIYTFICKRCKCGKFVTYPHHLDQPQNGGTSHLTSAQILDFSAVTSQEGGSHFRSASPEDVYSPSAPPMSDDSEKNPVTPPPSYEDAVGAPFDCGNQKSASDNNTCLTE